MRLPYAISEEESNHSLIIQDTQMIHQLADALNIMNNHHPDFLIDFIPWINDARVDPSSLSSQSKQGASAELELERFPEERLSSELAKAKRALDDFKALTPARVRKFAENIFLAHKEAVLSGHFNYSALTYMINRVGTALDVADQVYPSSIDWPLWETEDVYMMSTEWRTIQKGMQRLTDAFMPLVINRTRFHTKVSGLSFNATDAKVAVSSRIRNADVFELEETRKYDFVLNSVPFNLVRFWSLPNHSSRLRRAIDRMIYSGSAKTALLFESRFWEHLPSPIYGGCVKIDHAVAGEICYPSYDINGSRPGVIVSYISKDTDSKAICAMPEEEHVALLLKTLEKIHGPEVRQQYSHVHYRYCWEHDPYSGAAWSAPIIAQQPMYLSAYWRTEFNIVYIGEHTSITHSYIFSALESAVRGTVQILLHVGLIHEAKQICREWMARWSSEKSQASF